MFILFTQIFDTRVKIRTLSEITFQF